MRIPGRCVVFSWCLAARGVPEVLGGLAQIVGVLVGIVGVLVGRRLIGRSELRCRWLIGKQLAPPPSRVIVGHAEPPTSRVRPWARRCISALSQLIGCERRPQGFRGVAGDPRSISCGTDTPDTRGFPLDWANPHPLIGKRMHRVGGTRKRKRRSVTPFDDDIVPDVELVPSALGPVSGATGDEGSGRHDNGVAKPTTDKGGMLAPGCLIWCCASGR
ncbi:MAG: hypothetical protein QOH65_3092 [Methylobacteriaceae bacterium]|nr:hypothetical protein [Methylobacteriaceae bacterium]